jgi:dTDP-4-amino-4,6-dideoxygalactose transaminase
MSTPCKTLVAGSAMYLQPVLNKCEFHSHSDTESCGWTQFEHCVCLPSGPTMTDAQVNRVINALCDALGGGLR